MNYFTEFAITPAAEVDFDRDNASPASGTLRKRCQAFIEDVDAEEANVQHRNLRLSAS